MRVVSNLCVAAVQVEMSGFLKNELKVRSLVTNGNEGYRTAGTYGAPPPRAPILSHWELGW